MEQFAVIVEDVGVAVGELQFGKSVVIENGAAGKVPHVGLCHRKLVGVEVHAIASLLEYGRKQRVASPLIAAFFIPSGEHILEGVRREVERGHSIRVYHQIALFLLLHQQRGGRKVVFLIEWCVMLVERLADDEYN